MNNYLLLFTILACAITFLGGLFSLRFRNQAHLITSFSAGVVIGLAFFDLLPESIELLSIDNLSVVSILIALGFTIYLVLDRAFHGSHANEDGVSHVETGSRGILRASSLVIHSFLDGASIGFAFQVSTSLGFLVAMAVLAHKFSDGINTVTAIIKDGGKKIRAMKFLVLGSVAPGFGIVSTMFVQVSEGTLGMILALFCGFFLYIGASDLIPESYHKHPTKLTTFMTVLGMVFIFSVVHLAH